MSKRRNPTLDELHATMMALREGDRVAVTTRKYGRRELTVTADPRQSPNSAMVHVQLTSGRTMSSRERGGALTYWGGKDPWLTYQPTLRQQAEHVEELQKIGVVNPESARIVQIDENTYEYRGYRIVITRPPGRKTRWVATVHTPSGETWRSEGHGQRVGFVKEIAAAIDIALWKPSPRGTNPRGRGDCALLPEDPWSYFLRVPGTVMMHVEDLTPTRARPKGIKNAEKYMRDACSGKHEKRKPITVHPDTLKILDGNSTFAVAQAWGWEEIPVTFSRETNPHRNLDKNRISRGDYPSVFGDTDRDSIPDVDDPHPTRPGDTTSIEEVRLADEMQALLDTRAEFVPVLAEVKDRLDVVGIEGATIKGRVKTPYSILNKLRRKRLATLTDVAGAMMIVPDARALDDAAAAIESSFDVIGRDDYYARPKDGYRALHYIVRIQGKPVELQLKTQRMAQVAKASHTAYKRGALDATAMDELGDLAARADTGDRRAQQRVDALLGDKTALSQLLTRRSNPGAQSPTRHERAVARRLVTA